MAAIPALQETDPLFTDTSSPSQSKAVDFLTDYKTESERTKHLFNHSNYEGVNSYGYDQDLAGYLANLNGTQSMPTLTTSPAAVTSATSANVLFNVLATGGDAPDITVYWGLADGQTTPAAWDHTISAGARNVGAFSTAITGLTEGTSYYFTVKASNHQGTVWGSTRSFTAAGAANSAPAFKANPTNASNATAGLTYLASIEGAATDAEGDPLTYSKTSGPAWLSIAPNGRLSGIPSAGDVGDNVFTVRVSDGMGSNTITLNIAVNATQSPYATWTLGAFSKPGQLNTNPLDDFDSDGYNNQFEYYLGLNPESAANEKRPTASISDNYGAITFTYRTDNAALNYQIETTTDASSPDWTTRNTEPLDPRLVLINGPTPNPSEGTATVTYRYDNVFSDTPSLFFKINVSE